jgi:hypothetical protein
MVSVTAGCLAVRAEAGEPFHGDVHHRHVDRERHDHDYHHDHVRVNRIDREPVVSETTINHFDRNSEQVDGQNGRPAIGGRGTLYVLAVEVDHKLLEQGKPDDFAHEPAELARLLKQKTGGIYARVETRTLTGNRANRAGILAGFHWLQANMTPRDTALIFISSHGGFDNMGFFGVQPAGFREKQQQTTAVWGQEIRESLLETAGRKVFFLETCNSGAFLKTPTVFKPLPNTEIICSARVMESSDGTMDAALIEGLKGAAARNGVVTLANLENYVAQRVVKASNGKQHIMVSGPAKADDRAIKGPIYSSLKELALACQ